MQYVALSPDGTLAVGLPYDFRDGLRSSAGPPKPLVVLGVADRRTLLELDGGDGFAVPCCFNPQGDLLACRRGDGVVLVELSSGKEVLKVAPCQARELAFSPDGRRLAVAEADKGLSIRVLSAVSGADLCRIAGHRGPVNDMVFSSDGNVLVSASTDTTALAWSLAGLDDAPAAAPSEKKLEDLWDEMASDDGAKAFAATRAMAAAKDKAVPFLADRLRPLECDANRVRAQVGQLGDSKYAVRQSASDELRKLADAAEPLLREELKAARDEETRQRLRELLESVESPKAATPAVLRKARAVGGLERIGGAEAKAALEAASRQAAPAWVRAGAQAAMDRLAGNAGEQRK